jgi:hypothetical protein
MKLTTYESNNTMQTTIAVLQEMWSPTGNAVAPLGSADSLCELQYLVARHPEHKRIHPLLKTWLSAAGEKSKK